MAAYRRVNDSRHLQADCQVPGSSPEPYTLVIEYGLSLPFYPFFQFGNYCVTNNNYLGKFCFPSSFASFKSTLVLPFWCRRIQVVLEKRPLNWRSSISSIIITLM